MKPCFHATERRAWHEGHRTAMAFLLQAGLVWIWRYDFSARNLRCGGFPLAIDCTTCKCVSRRRPRLTFGNRNVDPSDRKRSTRATSLSRRSCLSFHGTARNPTTAAAVRQADSHQTALSRVGFPRTATDDAGQRPDNCEYPWQYFDVQHNPQVIVPAFHLFPRRRIAAWTEATELMKCVK